MSAQLYFIIFIVMAVLINVVIYGGITMAYVLEKRAGEKRAAGERGAGVAPEGAVTASEADRIGANAAA